MSTRLSSPRSRRRALAPRGRRGQSLVEFALVVPILLLLLLGIVDFARAWNVYEVLTDATREGTREAVVDNGKTEDEIKTIIKDAGARAGIAIQDGDIQIFGMGSGRGNPTTILVEYDYQLQWVGWLMGLAQGDRDLTLRSQFVMRNE